MVELFLRLDLSLGFWSSILWGVDPVCDRFRNFNGKFFDWFCLSEYAGRCRRCSECCSIDPKLLRPMVVLFLRLDSSFSSSLLGEMISG
jgi:hypothetical protein